MEGHTRQVLVGNSEVWETYYFYTAKLTEHAHRLGFGGVAICWFLRDEDGDFPLRILVGLLGFIIYFLLDMSQYGIGAWRVRRKIRRRERELESATGSREGDYSLPRDFDRPVFVLFWAKLVVLAAAFGVVGTELFAQM